MKILLTSVSIAPALLYMAAWGLGLRRPPGLVPTVDEPVPGRAPASFQPQGWLAAPGMGVLLSLLALVAVILHFSALYLAIASNDEVRFGFAHILSAAIWVAALLLLFEPDEAHASAMRILVFPVAAITAPLPWLFPGQVIKVSETAGALFVPHLLIGTLAYAVLFLALLHAVLMAGAERRLRAAPTDAGVLAAFIDRLPPLLAMERVLFRLVGFGFVLLTLTAVSGMFWSETIFGRPFRFDHKTVFTLLAWSAFATLLLGRWRWGWRGRTALRLTILGFVVMLLGYAGSRFVLEVILGRA